MPNSTISWHDGGPGRCEICGKQSPDRATFSRSDRVKYLLVCDECGQKIGDNVDGMYAKAMQRLD